MQISILLLLHALSFRPIHTQSTDVDLVPIDNANATTTAMVQDPCGPLVQPTPNPAGNTCEASITESTTPSSYGVQCLAEHHTARTPTTKLDFDACARETVPAICDKLSDPAAPNATWVWASASSGACFMGFYLPPFYGSAPKPIRDKCVEGIFKPMAGYCNPATGFVTKEGMYDLAMVNVKVAPDRSQNGQAVDAGYPSYILATRQLTG